MLPHQLAEIKCNILFQLAFIFFLMFLIVLVLGAVYTTFYVFWPLIYTTKMFRGPENA